jgi:hypothetical protein
MAITELESTSGSEMVISPRIHTIHEVAHQAHNNGVEGNIMALQPSNPTEPTLLEITEPDVTFEALS